MLLQVLISASRQKTHNSDTGAEIASAKLLWVIKFLVGLARRKLNINFEKRMKKSEIFAGILADVSAETEIDGCKILSGSRLEEVVDARYLVIFLLIGNGFYPGMIAERMGMTARGVRNAVAGFEARLACSPGLRLVCERVARKWLK